MIKAQNSAESIAPNVFIRDVRINGTRKIDKMKSEKRNKQIRLRRPFRRIDVAN